jgi:hypothetical protein
MDGRVPEGDLMAGYVDMRTPEHLAASRSRGGNNGGRPKGGYSSSTGPANPYDVKRHCTCERPQVFKDRYDELACLACGHAPAE